MPFPVLRAALAALCLMPVHQAVAQPISTQEVRFAPGTSGTVINDRLRGEEIDDYILGASARQRMVVDMTTSNPSAYFNITGPGANAAIFNGSIEGGHFDGVLPTGGDWTIRVYLMRNAGRRGETADYTLSINIGGAMTPPAPDFADGDAGGPDFWQVTASSLNIRSGPSTANPVVGRASSGQTFRNLGCQGTGDARWCHIEAPNGLLSGWVAGRFLAETGAAAAPSQPQAPSEVAAMGPDFWQVVNVASDDFLNIRAGVGTGASIVARAPNGTVLRNLGCQGLGDARWCHVETTDARIEGWVSGAYLQESGGPAASAPAVTIPSGSALAPDLHIRPSGEIEARWSSGCTVLFNPQRQQISAGSSCNEGQLAASEIWVRRLR